MTAGEERTGKVGERVSTPSRRWLPAVTSGLFIVGSWHAVMYIRRAPVPERLGNQPLFHLWTVLIGAVVGVALALLVLLSAWLVDILRLTRISSGKAVVAAVAVVLVALGTVFAALFLFAPPTDPLDQQLADHTRPLILTAALCSIPGLTAFLALRLAADGEAAWRGPGVARLRLLLELRALLRHLLATFGAFLTLMVVATGMRRRALLAADLTLPPPSEGVLLYGLVFAVLLGLFFGAAESRLDHRARRLLDEFTPLPDPADPTMADRLERRSRLGTLVGIGGSWQLFGTTVVIAAPLLTALIGIATPATDRTPGRGADAVLKPRLAPLARRIGNQATKAASSSSSESKVRPPSTRSRTIATCRSTRPGSRPARRCRSRNARRRRPPPYAAAPLPGCDVPADHGLGAVVEHRPGHPAEVRDRPPVAGRELGQIHRGDEAVEQVPGVRQRHVEQEDKGNHR